MIDFNDKIETIRIQLDTLNHNQQIVIWRRESLEGCECAKYEGHTDQCLGVDCNCH